MKHAVSSALFNWQTLNTLRYNRRSNSRLCVYRYIYVYIHVYGVKTKSSDKNFIPPQHHAPYQQL